MNLYGIVVAAGSGERFGRPKATVELRGVELWRWGVAALEGAGAISVVVVGDVPDGIPGGSRRRDSVAAGLAALPADASHVLIHDAARPLATVDLARAVVERLIRGDVAGVVPAIPIRDTVKRVDDRMVEQTVDREGLAIVQTPQGFDLEVLRRAHAADDQDASDDALLVEKVGGVVAVVPGESTNMKITVPDDLRVAEALLP